jgi:DnaK suppressor protein
MNTELPADYRPSPDEPYMNPRQLAYFRNKLLTWRQSLLEESRQTLEQLRAENLEVSDEAAVRIHDLSSTEYEQLRAWITAVDEAYRLRITIASAFIISSRVSVMATPPMSAVNILGSIWWLG